MNRNSWPPEERAEFDALVDDALAEDGVLRRRDVFLAGFEQALNARRLWARDLLRDFHDSGADRVLKREQERRQPRMLVAEDGQVLGSAPRTFGTTRPTAAGGRERQRVLFECLTFDELEAKRAELVSASNALRVDVKAIDRVLELRDRAPTARTPAEACELLGIEFEELLNAA